MTPLFQEINHWRSTEFEWGVTDCMMVLGAWVGRINGADPCDDIRYSYDSPASCQRETGYIRDPLGTMSRFAEVANLKPTQRPIRGDVGLVVDHNGQTVGALCTGDYWVSKGPHEATSYTPREIIAAWSVGYRE